MSTATERAKPYADAILSRAVHVLGLVDRERMSRTHGCMDRTFWAWKFTDFPGARFQEGVCALAFLWATPLPGSAYHRAPRLLEWIAAACDFWAAIQRPAGDFDEAYPWERSLAATAFTTFYVSEAFELVGGELPDETAERVRRAVGRAGEWLCRNDETHGFLSNHLAAAAGALHHAHRLTGEPRFAERSAYFLGRILEHQSSEGWYDEYGGADPGYQTHGSFYLARILELGGDPALADSLDRSFEFLAHFVHADGSLGGEYASRNTQTYYPAAFEMRAAASGAARWIADAMRPSVASLAAAGLGSVDAWNLFPLLHNYVFAWRAASAPGERAAAREPEPTPALRHFPKAGLVVARRGGYQAIVATRKGGVTKVFDAGRGALAASDCGYVGRLRGGGAFSSQWVDDAARVSVGDDEIRIETGFFEISRPVMDPYRFLAFRIFSLTLGRVPTAARWLKALLVKVLIYRKRAVDLRLERTVRLLPDGVEIRDALRGGVGERASELVQADAFATIHMGSSRYFVPHELLPGPGFPGGAAVDVSRLAAGVERVRRVRVG